MNEDQSLREQLTQQLDWGDAHVGFDAVIGDVPVEMRGVRPADLPYSLWHLLEHLRLAQADILDFCRNANYHQPAWPDDYWPKSAAPPTAEAWDNSVAAVREDRKSLIELVNDPKTNLFAKIEHGEGQTYLREVLLVADHNAYHLGEMVALRRLLGIWK
jgi:uncharacterized damage-inducible protein DinB